MVAHKKIVRLFVFLGIIGYASHGMCQAREHNLSCSLKDIENIRRKSGLEGKIIHVSLSVQVPGQPTFTRAYQVVYGYTAAKILEIDYNVGHGVVCCHPNDVKSVDGRDTDFAKNEYWFLTINENRDVSPAKTLLEDGDRVVWTYHKET